MDDSDTDLHNPNPWLSIKRFVVPPAAAVRRPCIRSTARTAVPRRWTACIWSPSPTAAACTIGKSSRIATALVWVPALAVHGFRFAPETEGLVVTLDQSRLRDLLDHLPELLDSLAEPRLVALDRGATLTRALFAVAHGLREDYAGAGAWRAPALDHAVALLATQAARFGASDGAQRGAQHGSAHAQVVGDGRALQHLTRYREQVERHYRRQPSVAELAEPLGITPTQLNRLCRRHLHCSALAVLHQRVLLEAKRELGYTNLMVRQIADGLGFADPAYFTRFFLRQTGRSPSAWRQQGG